MSIKAPASNSLLGGTTHAIPQHDGFDLFRLKHIASCTWRQVADSSSPLPTMLQNVISQYWHALEGIHLQIHKLQTMQSLTSSVNPSDFRISPAIACMLSSEYSGPSPCKNFAKLSVYIRPSLRNCSCFTEPSASMSNLDYVASGSEKSLGLGPRSM